VDGKMSEKEKCILATVIKFTNDVVIDLRAREWCKMVYPDHPKGCPNYGRRITCPPQAPIWSDVMEGPYVLVGIEFNLREWARKMKEKHPEWSERQCRCCLYWQGKVRKQLRIECEKIKEQNPELVISYCPEAMGVHVFETCYKNGIKLHKNPQDTVWKIAVIGFPKNNFKGD